MRFEHLSFACDVDVLRHGQTTVVRFYNGAREPREEDIRDLVIVDAGYGFLTLKIKGDAGLLGGFLDAAVFDSDEMAEAAVDFVIGLDPGNGNRHIPYHVDRVKRTGYVEYNGEY